MGCDIHSIVEVKQDGVWKVNKKKIFPNSYYRAEEKDKPKDQQWKWALNEFESSPSDGRNYDWFAILADVRNGRGFAGVKTGDGFAVIAEPRGVPDDATSKWKKTVEDWNGDMHSHSYLYVKDFNEFDWNQVTMKTGVITLKEYEELKVENKSPESWCGSVSSPDMITVDEETADKILAGENPVLVRKKDFFSDELISKPASEWGGIYVLYNWPVIYSEWFQYNIKNVVEPLKKLAEDYEDVRLVFGFDN